MNVKHMQKNIDNFWKVGLLSFLAIALVIVPEMSFAQSTFCTVLTNILALLQGTPAKVIATMAIIFLGITAFFGKLNWGTALLVGVGIAAVFGAATIVTAVAGNPGGGAC